jgi:hypothetical protein
MPEPHPVYAEIGTDGGALLYSLAPPGLVGRGASLAEATEQASAHGIAELLAMAATAGRALLTDGRASPWPATAPTAQSLPYNLTIVETQRRRGAVANGNTTATFGPDREPLLPGEVPAMLELLAESRRRLLAWRPILETAPDAGELLSFRSSPHRKTVAEQLMHVANAERWYLVRIQPELPRLPDSRTPWERLDAVRGLVVHTLARLSPAQLAAQHEVDGELWTARKVVRRLMYHEQFHRDTIVRDLRLAMAARRG